MWSKIVIILILICGIYLTFKTKFLIFTHTRAIFKETIGSIFKKNNNGGKISPFAAMSAALSGTMGTGNIIGVGIAIMSGGPGSVLWMCLSAFLCMSIKYAEIVLAIQYRQTDSKGNFLGGPMYYIKNGLPKLSFLSVIFCIATIAASIGVGNISQSGSISASLQHSFGIDPLISGFLTLILCSFIIFGSVKRLTSFTSLLVPFMSVFYLIGVIIVLVKNYSNIPIATELVLQDAFNFKSANAGIFGFLTSQAFRHGIAKGVFTNEAGLGSASIVHATADNSAQKQGYWGIFEVFADTVIMCTLTGFAIISSNSFLNQTITSGENLTAAAFNEVFGNTGGVFISISVILFAIGAIVSWNYYGAKCCEFLSNKKLIVFFFNIVFCTFIVLGSVLSMNTIFDIADILNTFMAIPNIIAILLLFNKIDQKKLK